MPAYGSRATNRRMIPLPQTNSASMALLETLLNAQWEAGEKIGEARGEARGRAEANAEFEAWKARQRDAGVEFVDEDSPTEIPPASDIVTTSRPGDHR